MKTKIYTLTILILCSIASFGQVPNWTWAKSEIGNGSDAANSVAADAQNNSYITGTFTSSSIIFGGTSLSNYGTSNIFVVKYGHSGNVRWARRIGGSGGDWAQSIAVDNNGSVYITGFISSSSVIFANDTINNGGGPNVITAKYDSSGNEVWIRCATHNYFGCQGRGVSIDNSGNIYVTGIFGEDSVSFNGHTVINNGTVLTSDIFLVKYNSSGDVVWARNAGGTNNDFSRAVSTSMSGIYLTGYFKSPSVIFAGDTLFNQGNKDILTLKYDSLGNEVWAKSSGGINDEEGLTISVNKNDFVYVAGYFKSSPISFPPFSLNGNSDCFIVRYDKNGNAKWAGSQGGINDDETNGVYSDACGNAYITGWFRSPTVFFGATMLSDSGLTDVFIAKYDSSGIPSWAKWVGSINDESGNGITADANLNLYVAGDFQVQGSTLTFDSTTLINTGTDNAFIGKIKQCNLAAPIITSIGQNLQSSSGATYQWFWNGNTINGATSQTYSPTQNGNYSVLITDANCCSAISTIHSWVGINQLGNANQISVSPNPVTDILFVQGLPFNSKIEIQNLTGQILFSETVNENATIDMSKFSEGIYILKTENGIRKIVKL